MQVPYPQHPDAQFPEEAMAQCLAVLEQHGVRVLSPFMLEPDEAAHCAELLRMMDPPPGARVIDMGAGVGEVARLMERQRPDLEFTLLNTSAAQLAASPRWMRHVYASFDDTGEPDNSHDVVLFSQAIQYTRDMGRTMHEAARIARPGGCVFVFGFIRESGDNDQLLKLTHTWAGRADETTAPALDAGLRLDFERALDAPLVDFSWDPNHHVFVEALAGVRPYVWRFIKPHLESDHG